MNKSNNYKNTQIKVLDFFYKYKSKYTINAFHNFYEDIKNTQTYH